MFIYCRKECGKGDFNACCKFKLPSPVHVYLESVSYLSGRRCRSETPSEASDIWFSQGINPHRKRHCSFPSRWQPFTKYERLSSYMWANYKNKLMILCSIPTRPGTEGTGRIIWTEILTKTLVWYCEVFRKEKGF